MMRSNALSISMAAAILMLLAGCSTESNPPVRSTAISTTQPVFTPTTQPVEVIASLSTLQITRADLDQLLYQSYGLRMLFDLVELDLAKNTLKDRGTSLTPDDIHAERQKILAGIAGEDTPPSRYEEVFNQFLQREHITRAEFDLKIIETDACLRKIVTPMVVGKLPETDVHKGFEALYGAKREIADIELANQREAQIARDRLKTQAFEQVAADMSIDAQTASSGGRWQPFSQQDPRVAKVIREQAFALEKGQVSDIIVDPDSHYHLIKLINIIEPEAKIVTYDAVKDEVRKKLEDQLITYDMKQLRQELTIKAQIQLEIAEPILKGQWNDLKEKAKSDGSDREGARNKLNDSMHRTTTQPATRP